MSGNMFQVSNQINLEAARVGFHAAFMQQLARTEDDPLAELFLEVTSTASIEEWQWLGDLPGFQEWKGDRNLDDLSAFKMQIANKDWSSGIRAHQNQFKDDRLGLFPMEVAGMAQNAKEHRFELMVKMMLNGFNGTAYPETGNGLSYDGAFLISNSHAVDGGPAQSNYVGAVPLTVSSMEAADTKLKTMKTANGKRPLNLRGTHLVVGPALEWVAKKFMTAETIANTNGTAGETNVHRNQYKVLVSPWITGAQALHWFIADLSRPIKPFIFQLREDISTSAILGNQGGDNDSAPRFNRGEYWFGAEARYNVGAFAWQMLVGANPTAANGNA